MSVLLQLLGLNLAISVLQRAMVCCIVPLGLCPECGVGEGNARRCVLPVYAAPPPQGLAVPLLVPVIVPVSGYRDALAICLCGQPLITVSADVAGEEGEALAILWLPS